MTRGTPVTTTAVLGKHHPTNNPPISQPLGVLSPPPARPGHPGHPHPRPTPCSLVWLWMTGLVREHSLSHQGGRGSNNCGPPRGMSCRKSSHPVLHCRDILKITNIKQNFPIKQDRELVGWCRFNGTSLLERVVHDIGIAV